MAEFVGMDEEILWVVIFIPLNLLLKMLSILAQESFQPLHFFNLFGVNFGTLFERTGANLSSFRKNLIFADFLAIPDHLVMVNRQSRRLVLVLAS